MDSHESRPPDRKNSTGERAFSAIVAGAVGFLADSSVIRSLTYNEHRDVVVLAVTAAIGAVATGWSGYEYAQYWQIRDSKSPE